MKRVFAIALATLFFTATGFAQKGNNQVGGGLDLSFPTGDFSTGFKTGFGLYAKGLYGVGDAGQVTFTTGYSTFKMKGSTGDFKMTMGIIPLLVGYRHYYQGFFAEPQIGYGIYRAKVKTDLDELEDFEGTDSEGAFTWALNAGYIFQEKFEAGIRFQNGHKDGAGIGMFGIRLGYNFAVGSK